MVTVHFISVLRNAIHPPQPYPNKKVELNKELIIDNISFMYKGQKQNIIENLNLKINKEGDLIGIFGDSGVGKTTLIDILIGFHLD